MIAPPVQRTLTTSEYLRMAEEGIIAPDEKVELIEGVIYRKSPQSNRHHASLMRLVHIMFTKWALGPDRVSSQTTLVMSDDTALEPDVYVHAQARHGDYTSADDILLAVEVAVSNSSKELERRLGLYAKAGLREVWILRPAKQVVEIYTALDADSLVYTSRTVLSGGDLLKPTSLDVPAVPVSSLFEED